MSTQIPALEGLSSYAEALGGWQAMALDVNRKAFEPYSRCFANKEVAIIGCGPTLNFFRPIPNAINIGVNSAILASSIKLDYFFCSDYSAFVEVAHETRPDMPKFYAHSVKTPFSTISDEIVARHNAIKFYTRYNISFKEDYNFGADISRNLLRMPNSIIFAALFFALHGGAAKIYLVGCDCGSSRLDTTGKVSAASPNTGYEVMIDGWWAVKQLVTSAYPDTPVISVNPRGLRGMFKDMYQSPYAVAALNHKDLGEYDKASRRAARALAQDRENRGLLALNADMLRKCGRNDEAISLLQGTLRKDKFWFEGYKLLSEILLEADRPREALEYLTAALGLPGANPEAHAQLALTLYRLGYEDVLAKVLGDASRAVRMLCAYRIFQLSEWNPNRGECISLLRDSLRLFNEWPHAHYSMAMHMRAVGETGCMENAIKEAMQNSPALVAAGHRFLAWTALDRGLLDEALEQARLMWAADPVWDATHRIMLQVLIASKRYSEALALAAEIEATTPEADYLPFYLSLIHDGMGKSDLALKYAEQAITAYPVMKDAARIGYLGQYIAMLHRNGKLDKAEEYLSHLAQAYGDNTEILKQMTTLYNFKGNREAAIQGARTALATDPANTRLSLLLIDTLQRYGHTDEALEILNARLVFTPNWSQGWRKKAELLRSLAYRGADEEVIACARKAHETDPDSITMLDFYTSTRKSISYIDALEEYEKGIERDPGWGNGWVQLYGYYRDVGELDTALNYAHEAVEQAPGYIWGWVALSDILIQVEDVELAELVVREFAEKFPESGLPLRQMAKICQARGQHGQALLWMRKACMQFPTEITALWNAYLAMLHGRKLYQDEKTALRQALKANPHWLTGWQKLADLSSAPKDKLYYFEQATALNPSWADGWKQLSDLTGVPDEKTEYLERAARMAPQRLNLWQSLLGCLSDEEKRKGIYREALKYHPNWAEGHYQLSLLYS